MNEIEVTGLRKEYGSFTAVDPGFFCPKKRDFGIVDQTAQERPLPLKC